MLKVARLQIRFNSSTAASAAAVAAKTAEVRTRTVKTPVGIKAAIESLKPKATRLSMDGPVECALSGFSLLNSPQFNKGSAFSKKKESFDLTGLLPSQVNSLDEQVERAYRQFSY